MQQRRITLHRLKLVPFTATSPPPPQQQGQRQQQQLLLVLLQLL